MTKFRCLICNKCLSRTHIKRIVTVTVDTIHMLHFARCAHVILAGDVVSLAKGTEEYFFAKEVAMHSAFTRN